MYKAHKNEKTGAIQTVKEHSESTAKLCREFAIPELKQMMYVMGLLHDIGKYQPTFQRRISGENVKIEHSICGAQVAGKKYNSFVGLMMEYCIAGHHGGIPDGGFDNDTPDKPTLGGRRNRETEDYGGYREELDIPMLDERALASFLLRDCGNDKDKLLDKYAFLTRYCFSCLTDADSLDTAIFCGEPGNRSLKADFPECLKKIDAKLGAFVCTTELQRARAVLQRQVFGKCGLPAEIYLMNMPTGSGKTLCSAKFALERAVRGGKKRIIYIIPYNSIIDQTADTFGELFGESADILRHQSTFSFDDLVDRDEDYRATMKFAAENWDAQFIITTAVQFFESIYANKRGKLRKLHNMADSILIFDEAHLMPQEYLQPCLEAIAYITKYLNSEAVFLTATMPDFRNLIAKYALPDSKIVDLIDDFSQFSLFQKCRYSYLGEQSEEALACLAKQYPSSLIVVNRRASAKSLFGLCGGKKYHLSTYMTAYDRRRVIDEIKAELQKLEGEYPDFRDIPEDRRIVVVSTSLIEAGVDLDFHTVFRELSGLDSILQAGGRCNREGKRKMADVYIFSSDSRQGRAASDDRGNIARGLLAEYDDISCRESISDYYRRLYATRDDQIRFHAINQLTKELKSIPFCTYAEHFELIGSNTVSIVVARDEKSRKLVEQLRATGAGNGRELQKYALTVYRWEFDDLLSQHVINDYGSGIWCLTNPDYYDEQTGVIFEAKDYFA